MNKIEATSCYLYSFNWINNFLWFSTGSQGNGWKIYSKGPNKTGRCEGNWFNSTAYARQSLLVATHTPFPFFPNPLRTCTAESVLPSPPDYYCLPWAIKLNGVLLHPPAPPLLLLLGKHIFTRTLSQSPHLLLLLLLPGVALVLPNKPGILSPTGRRANSWLTVVQKGVVLIPRD